MSAWPQLAEQYAAALEDYLSGAGEHALHFAYELGRRAIADGVGVLDMVAIHNEALAAVFNGPLTREEAVKKAGRASGFFAESLAAYEMALRGFRDANSALRLNIEQIQRAEAELQRQNRELVLAQRQLDGERQRYHDLFNFAPDSYLVTDLNGTIQEANRPAAALLQTSPELLPGRSLPGLVVEQDRESLRAELEWLRKGALEKLALWQIAVMRPDGGSVPVSLTVGVVRDSDGTMTGLRWLLRDNSERKAIEEERGRLRIREHLVRIESEATRRLKFLGEASSSLAGSLNYEKLPESIAALCVPRLADCCLVHLTDGSMTVREFAAVHIDHAYDADLQSLSSRWCERDLPPAIADVLNGGTTRMISDPPQKWLQQYAAGAENLTVLEKLNPACMIVTPLIARGRPLGAITLLSSAGAKRYTADDVGLADELAHRCALILENARLYRQVVIEKEKAEKASRAREEFVAILSHELRTPLMTILGWSHVLSRESKLLQDPMLGDAVKSLEHNSQHIARLVEDCLDISRISEGKIHLRKELVDVGQIVQAGIDASRALAAAKELTVNARLASAIGVWGDRMRLEQVVLNLLTNAIKYTDTGGQITVSSRAVNNEAELEVKDTGIGIEPDFLEHIFQPFRQGAGNWYTLKSGLGLGLAIAREIVEMHGGRIWAESAGPGCGSAFHVRLPLALSTEVREKQAIRKRRVSAGKPLRVLFIEDSRDILNLIKTELEQFGYSVLTASDGRTGLETAKRELPDIIISDIKMPGFDGYELIRQVRQTPQLSATPAIALTGFGMKKDVDKALEAGYSAHLAKPAELDELTALIEKLAAVLPDTASPSASSIKNP
ncbi:MAG: response regulator [Acidobacteria bacterium]|nr:response regulator [Acidobacteriota bacterium]